MTIRARIVGGESIDLSLTEAIVSGKDAEDAYFAVQAALAAQGVLHREQRPGPGGSARVGWFDTELFLDWPAQVSVLIQDCGAIPTKVEGECRDGGWAGEWKAVASRIVTVETEAGPAFWISYNME